MRKHLYKLALIVTLGSGFALAQGMPQQQTPQSAPPITPQTQQNPPVVPDLTQPATPDQGKNPANAPENLPNIDQKDQKNGQKLPQSDTMATSSTDMQSNIQLALQKDPSLANANVSVLVSGKNVELSGTVPTKDAKVAAERIAKENSGSLKVKSHIKVSEKSSVTPTSEKPKSDYPKK